MVKHALALLAAGSALFQSHFDRTLKSFYVWSAIRVVPWLAEFLADGIGKAYAGGSSLSKLGGRGEEIAGLLVCEAQSEQENIVWE